MAVTSGRVKVKATATKIVGFNSNSIAQQTLVIRNVGSESIDLGGPKVETGKGYTLPKETTLPALVLGSDSVLYGVAAEGKEVEVQYLGV